MRFRARASAQLRSGFDRFTPALLFCSAIYLYANLFAFPNIPFLLSGDQVYLWMNAQRMLHGERIYQDFFQFTPPGADLLYLGFFKLFLPNIWVTNAIVLAVGVIACWVCYEISKLVMERQQALLAASIFLVLIYGKLLNGTHHWFSVLAAMAAVAILMKARTPARIAIAGSLLGLASFFTQTRGLVTALAIVAYLVWGGLRAKESWASLLRCQALLFLPFLATLAALSGYFIATTGIKQLWYFQITYVWHFMVNGFSTASLGLPATLTWRSQPGLGQYLVVYVLLPVAYAIALRRCWRKSHNPPSPETDRILLLTLAGIAMLLEVALSVNWLRLFCVAMPGIILLAWILGSPNLRAHATGLMWVAVLCLAFLQTWARQHREYRTVDLPAGRAAASPQTHEKLQWLMQNTKPGDLFFQAGWPGLYLPLASPNPAYLDVLETGDQTRPRYVESSIRQLQARQVRFILWSPRLNSPESFRPPEAYHLAPFCEFLHSHYRLLQTFSDQDEVWERTASPLWQAEGSPDKIEP
jgi:hypothetical protein